MPLQHSYIHAWLVAGLHTVFVRDLERFAGEDFKLQIARQYYEHESIEHATEALPVRLPTQVEQVACLRATTPTVSCVPRASTISGCAIIDRAKRDGSFRSK